MHFYLIESLNGKEKAKLLNNILCILHEKKINVVSITFDGATSNIAMCEVLGAQLKHVNIVSYFYHPVDKSKHIYIFYDACHMLKLVRNAMSKNVIKDKDKKAISWNVLKELVNLQTAEKLHVANKMRKRHKFF